MPENRSTRRRWFQFSLRSLLLAMTAFAIWLGWKVDRARKQAAAVRALRQQGGFVYYDFQYAEKKDKPKADAEPWEPRWLLGLLGVDFFHQVRHVSLVYGYDDKTGKRVDLDRSSDKAAIHLKDLHGVERLFLADGEVTDEAMQYVGELSNLKHLYLWDAAALTDRGAAHLAGLKRLKYLHLNNSKVTDKLFEYVGQCPKLESLALQGNAFTDEALARAANMRRLKELWVGLGPVRITDAGLASLKKLTTLERLDVQRSQVTDAGMKHLAEMKELKDLDLGGTKMTDAGLRELASLARLERLDISSTAITDASLPVLKSFKKLRWLKVDSTRISNASVEELRAAMPSLTILR